MENQIKINLNQSIKQFQLPRYAQITDIGLFLEQTMRMVNGYLEPLGGMELTSSMISNYVKQKLIKGPYKKQYGAEQIAYLIFIAVAKNVLSLDEIRLLLQMQQEEYELSIAYDYFCDEFETVLQQIFGEDEKKEGEKSDSHLKELLKNMVVTVVHKIYLEKYFAEMHFYTKK